MTPKMPLRLESTGEPSFDSILGGGIPAQSVVVIAGEPGSGKTVFALQMLFHAARAGKTCLYFTTASEPAIKLIRNMQLFDFFDADLLDRQIIFRDLGAAIREGPDRALADISEMVEKHAPSFVAIDSFRAIADLLPDARVGRSFAYDLATHMAGWGITTLLIGEYAAEEFSRYPEFAIADGIIRFGAQRQELTSVRELEVLKLRATNHVSGRHFFEISHRGLFVYPRVRGPQAGEMPAVASAGRATTGVRGLDDLLNGGLPRSSNAVLQGGAGTGKTVLGLAFLIDGARRQEKGVLFALEETPDQLRSFAASLGWDLADFEQQGLILIHYTSPVELSTDRYLHTVREEVQKYGARRAVFDGLTSMALGVPSERRFKELVYAITKHMRLAGVTFMMTMESPQLLGAEEITGHGISFAADNLIQFRYVEIDGRLERAIRAQGPWHQP